MRAWWLVGLLTLAGCAKSGAPASPMVMVDTSDLTMVEMSELVFRPKGTFDERRLLTSATADPRPEVAALAVAAVYPTDKARWADALYAHFSVEDFAARKAGEAEMVRPAESRGTLLSIRDGRDPKEHRMVAVLMAFQQWRHRNAWVVHIDESISLARAYRSNFLTAVWADHEDRGKIDVLAELAALDERAREAAEQAAVGEATPTP